MNYSELLKDPRWQKKRLEVFARDSYACCYCGDTKTELHVHHEKYSGEPWEANLEDLKTACKHCHAVISRINKTLKRSVRPSSISKTRLSKEHEVELLVFITAGNTKFILFYDYQPDGSVKNTGLKRMDHLLTAITTYNNGERPGNFSLL